MKIVKTNYKLLLLLSSIFLIGGCSTKESIAVSQAHLYNDNYGLVSDSRADKIIASENEPVDTDYSSLDPKYTTELEKDSEKDSDTIVGEDWVPPAPKITYKYMDDPHFYSENELPKNKLRTGKVIADTSEDTDTSVLYSRR